MDIIRFATIGTNFIVDWFTTAAKYCPQLEYEVTYSRNKETAKAYSEKMGSNRYTTDLMGLARDEEVDAVYIASPTSCHYEQAKLMLENGKHVLCEKPATSNYAELCKLVELAESKDLVFMEGMRCVHTEGFKWIKENMYKLGTVRRATFQYCQYSSRYDKFKAGIIENAFKPELSNGALMDIGVYCSHSMMSLFGEPESVFAQSYMIPNSIDGEGTIVVNYPEMMGEIIYSKITNSKLPSQIQGEKGAMIIREIPHPQHIEIIYNDGTKEEYIKSVEGFEDEHGILGEVQDWTRIINSVKMNTKDKESCLAEMAKWNRDSLNTLKLMDEARRQQGIVWNCEK